MGNVLFATGFLIRQHNLYMAELLPDRTGHAPCPGKPFPEPGTLFHNRLGDEQLICRNPIVVFSIGNRRF